MRITEIKHFSFNVNLGMRNVFFIQGIEQNMIFMYSYRKGTYLIAPIWLVGENDKINKDINEINNLNALNGAFKARTPLVARLRHVFDRTSNLSDIYLGNAHFVVGAFEEDSIDKQVCEKYIKSNRMRIFKSELYIKGQARFEYSFEDMIYDIDKSRYKSKFEQQELETL